jgi:endonuclease YncB( thermonuclease family)
MGKVAAGAAMASALVVLLHSPDASAAVLQGPARVVDGDTIVISNEKIRIYGVDAPESKQQCTDRAGRPYACGLTSASALTAKLEGKAVECSVKNKDQYGRNVAACRVGSEDIGAWLVQNGHAVAYKCALRQCARLGAPQQRARPTGRAPFNCPFD